MKKIEPDVVSRLPETAVLALSVLIALLIGYLSYQNALDVSSAARQLQISLVVRDLTADLLSALKDAETGQRGFLITGEEQFLEPYNQALIDVPRILRRFKEQVTGRPDQIERVTAIEPLISSKLGELKATIDLYQSNRKAEALAVVRQGYGKATMDQIRQRLGAITAVAQARSARLSAAAEESTRRLRLVSTSGTILLLAFLAVLALAISSGTRRREELYRRARASEKLWATTVSSIADAVIVTDGSGKITFINSVARELSGWSETDALGTPVTQALHMVNEETRANVDNPIERAIRTGKPVGLANHTISKDGREISIDDSAAPIRDEDGRIVGAVLVFRDITSRRQSERALTDSADALRRANEELQLFAYTASHDLRSPLSSVNAMAQLLSKRFADQLGEQGKEVAGFIAGAAGRLTRLIDDILSFANAGEVNRGPALPVDLNQVLERTLANLADEIKETGALVESDPLPSVLAHETPMLQMFQNLLGNALKYRGDAPPRVLISAGESGTECVISVKDNGIGIAPPYAEEIFKPFKRLHGPEYPGSGIGLASCKKIAAAYGGRIWVTSEAGKGSTFFFSVPAARKPEPSTPGLSQATQ
jgi:PAS domain S-box-containing protein